MVPSHRRSPIPRGDEAGVSLVELLVAMSVLIVVTTMILVTWFALQSSFANTSRASSARESARDSVARMTREIRDAQGYDGSSPIVRADHFEIVFYSTFNQEGNSVTGSDPVQIAYAYRQSAAGKGGTIYRVVDRDGSPAGVADELLDVPQYGRVVVDNVVNWWEPSETAKTSMFKYTYFADNGVYKTVDSMTGLASTARVLSVQINVLTDLNPGHSPIYMNLKTTAQPRNGRPAT